MTFGVRQPVALLEVSQGLIDVKQNCLAGLAILLVAHLGRPFAVTPATRHFISHLLKTLPLIGR